MKISVSLLSSYLYCSRKLFLEKVLHLEEPPKKRLEGVSLNMLEAYKKSFPFIMEESSIRAANIFSFIEENNVFGEELWQKLTPKIISELRIDSDELRLKGIIDQVHVYGNDYVPFELKTGRMPKDGVWPSHRIQIAAYSLLLQEKFKKPIKEGFVLYLDSKEKRHIAINPFMKQEVKQLVDEVIALLESMELPDFCNNENKCRKCGLKQTCYNEEEVNNLLKIKVSG